MVSINHSIYQSLCRFVVVRQEDFLSLLLAASNNPIFSIANLLPLVRACKGVSRCGLMVSRPADKCDCVIACVRACVGFMEWGNDKTREE